MLPLIYDDLEVVRTVREIVFWGLPWIPLVYWFTVVRNFVTVMQRPMIVSICAVAGLPVSFLSNYVFMYGNWGAPEMGAAAVGLTGVIVAVLHLAMIVAYVQYVPELRRYRIFARLLHFDRKMMVELFRVGIPIGMAYLFETGLFFTITLLMGILSTEALAAHNVVLNVCAVTLHDSLCPVAGGDGARRLCRRRRGARSGAACRLRRGLARHRLDDDRGRAPC